MSLPIEFLNRPLQYLKGVGPNRAKVLAEAGISTYRDLLHFYPRKHLDRSTLTPIRSLTMGGDPTTVVGTVRVAGVVPGRGRRRFEVVVEDEAGGRLKCVWFQRTQWVSKAFSPGDRVALHGRVQRYGGQPSMSHPDFDKLDSDGPSLDTGRIIALYPGSASFGTVGLNSRSFRRIIYRLFKEQGMHIPEVLPEWIREEYDLMNGRVALRAIHFPKDQQELARARQRLIFEELFFVQIMLARLRRHQKKDVGARFESIGPLSKDFVTSVLPFELTGSQKKAIKTVLEDTRSGLRMNRLLQGDVGSGKTVVAVAALLHAIDNGYQAAFMAPTEILAEQHYRNLQRYINPLQIGMRLLVGGMRKSQRTAALADIATGSAQIVVGTHALIQEGVVFRRLGLAVIDEQHRFGVLQRAEMFQKGIDPHILLMTATPIPRSLAMTLYGDLDVTVMRDMPGGRKPIRTQLRYEKDRDAVYKQIQQEIEKGRQAYVVYPLVSESEKLDLKDAETGYERICKVFPDAEVRIVHGRMSSEEKDAAMRAFKGGDVDILVSTTVIEVGVDVPNASVMVIEHAERFGLSQLHQLRGRVGRGAAQSYCILLADYKRTADARERLKTMTRTNDGFEISEMDLELRGAGDFFGTKQSGIADLKIANLARDVGILSDARETAQALIDRDPQMTSAEHGPLRAYFETFYEDEVLGLAKVG